VSIDPRILDAYRDYAGEQVGAGILTCRRWEEAMLAGTSIAQWMVDELRTAGRLPEWYDDHLTVATP
jgi:hypothetical protein